MIDVIHDSHSWHCCFLIDKVKILNIIIDGVYELNKMEFGPDHMSHIYPKAQFYIILERYTSLGKLLNSLKVP